MRQFLVGIVVFSAPTRWMTGGGGDEWWCGECATKAHQEFEDEADRYLEEFDSFSESLHQYKKVQSGFSARLSSI